MCRNYNDEKATMEMQRTGEFDREHQGKMVLKSLADRAGSKKDQLNEVKDKITNDIVTTADYSELGLLLITVAGIALILPIGTVIIIQHSRFRTTD